MGARTSMRIPAHEVTFTAIRAQGAGGQNVNKVSSAVQLRYDVHASALPQAHKQRLLALPDSRIGAGGVVTIKAQTHRSQGLNRAEAMRRLEDLVASVATAPKRRIATKPSRAVHQSRLEAKARHGALKASRRVNVEV